MCSLSPHLHDALGVEELIQPHYSVWLVGLVGLVSIMALFITCIEFHCGEFICKSWLVFPVWRQELKSYHGDMEKVSLWSLLSDSYSSSHISGLKDLKQVYESRQNTISQLLYDT